MLKDVCLQSNAVSPFILIRQTTRKALDPIQFLLKSLGKFLLTQTAEEQIPGETAAASPRVVEGALGQVVGLGKRAALSYRHSSMTGTSYRNAENFEIIK